MQRVRARVQLRLDRLAPLGGHLGRRRGESALEQRVEPREARLGGEPLGLEREEGAHEHPARRAAGAARGNEVGGGVQRGVGEGGRPPVRRVRHRAEQRAHSLRVPE